MTYGKCVFGLSPFLFSRDSWPHLRYLPLFLDNVCHTIFVVFHNFILFLIGKTGRIRKKVFKKPSIGVSSPARPSVSDFPFSGTCVGIRSITDTLTYARTRTHTQTHKHTINCENDQTMVRDNTRRFALLSNERRPFYQNASSSNLHMSLHPIPMSEVSVFGIPRI